MTRYITVTETAKLIRQDLKKNFPNIKFSVRSKSYSMGASIDISYTGNVKQETVMSVTNKYRGSGFDVMQDLKYSVTGELNGESVHFGSDYVFVSRHFSKSEVEKFAEFIANHYNFEDAITGDYKLPEYEITESEYSGASVNPLNSTMFGNRYFESYVNYIMHDYNDFEQFIREEHSEYYEQLFGKVLVESVKPQEIIVDIVVKLEREWTWVYGVTHDNKKAQELLKTMGFRFSNKRKSWYNPNDVLAQVTELLGVE